MKQVAVSDAKIHLSRLLDEVERRETVTITRHGRPVAKLVPVSGANKRTVEEAIAAMREFGVVALLTESRSRTSLRKAASIR